MTIKKILDVTHEDIKKRAMIECVKFMQRELGFKCVVSSYYLKEAIENIQRTIRKAIQSNADITENTKLHRHDECIIAGDGVDEVEIKMLTHGYQELLFDAMMGACK